MGCCFSVSPGEEPNDVPVFKNGGISKPANPLDPVEKSQPLLSGPDHLAFQNVVDLSSSSSIDQNVLEDLMKSSSDTGDSDLDDESLSE